MTSTDRNELFAALAMLAEKYPHWRIGQLVANVAGWADAEIWDAEDAQLLAAVRHHLGESMTSQNGTLKVTAAAQSVAGA